MTETNKNYSVVCYGEALWDYLPQKVVLGGAPMNVAYHLKKLQKDAAIISRVGLDKIGKELITMLEKESICTSYFQMDFERITGKVYVKIKENNRAIFDIVYPVAWDFIEWEAPFSPLVQQAEYFVFGSLITRNRRSRYTLYKLLEQANTKLLDINLRPPFYNRSILEELLTHANVLKLTLSELDLLTGWFSRYNNEIDRIKALKEQFDLDTIILTKGSKGAVINIGDKFYHHPGYKVNVTDKVGGGDAFLAAYIYKSLEGTTPEEMIDFANKMAALVTTYSGACPQYNINELNRFTTIQV